ncbi:transcription factor ILR3-like [Silene latifolia]|uniref:transcription factor ILR3-like n=1 Tax=Silene latifolia TaxID=37657 RepID=UPI003D78601E
MVKMLHDEINTLKSQNVELKQTTNELKAEKNKLRSKKLRLKEKKDHIEQRIKTLGIPHHSMKLPPTPYVVPKLMPVFSYPAVPMWNFPAHTSLNTSKDHAHNPPVA